MRVTQCGCMAVCCGVGCATQRKHMPGAGGRVKALWTVDTLPQDFARVGFTVQMMEWFDADGTFHSHQVRA